MLKPHILQIFKGIPYANPPVGALRYDSPAPLPPFSSRNDVYVANVTKPACPRTYEEALNRTRPEDGIRSLRKALDLEDCLYLDIYVPYHRKHSCVISSSMHTKFNLRSITNDIARYSAYNTMSGWQK